MLSKLVMWDFWPPLYIFIQSWKLTYIDGASSVGVQLHNAESKKWEKNLQK